MTERTIRYVVTIGRPFVLPGYSDELPAGAYEALAEEELLEGLSFEAWRRTATYLTVRGAGAMAGRMELRPVTVTELEAILRPADDCVAGSGDGQLPGLEEPK